MLIEYVVDSLDQVGDELKGAYVEADGKFNFDADKYAEIKAAGLKKKNNELLGKLKTNEGELAKFGKFKPIVEALADVDDDDIPHVIEAWQKRSQQDTKGKGGDDSTKLKEQLEKAHAKALKQRDDELGLTKTELQKAHARLRDYELWTPLREVFIKAGGEPTDWEIVRLELGNQQRFGFDDDSKIVVMEDGYPSTVTPEHFFKVLYSDQRPKFYKATVAAGSGAQNNTRANGNNKTMTRSTFEALDQSGRMKAAKDGIQVVDV